MLCLSSTDAAWPGWQSILLYKINDLAVKKKLDEDFQASVKELFGVLMSAFAVALMLAAFQEFKSMQELFDSLNAGGWAPGLCIL